MRRWLALDCLYVYQEYAYLALRLLTGGFLIYGTQDNVFSAERMEEFVGFLAANGFAAPEIMAPLSVYAQFVCGILFVLGALTRWAGLLMVFNFIVGIAMVHWDEDFRAWWPAIVLVFISLLFASRGAGPYSVDARFRKNAEESPYSS